MIRVGDLKDQTGKPEPRPVLYCDECGGEFSANKSDYFNYADSHVLTHCGRSMRHVRKQTAYRDVRP